MPAQPVGQRQGRAPRPPGGRRGSQVRRGQLDQAKRITARLGVGSDRLMGMNGRDYLNGSDGSDLIVAGQSSDTITGGSGNDTVFGGTGNDWIVATRGDGNDDYYGDASSGPQSPTRSTWP